jgi:hypothetical protein
VVDTIGEIGGGILKTVPGAGEVSGAIGVVVEYLPVAASAMSEGTIEILERKEVIKLVKALTHNSSEALEHALPPDMATIVGGSIAAVVTGDRAVRALVERQPDKFLDAEFCDKTRRSTREKTWDLRNLSHLSVPSPPRSCMGESFAA